MRRKNDVTGSPRNLRALGSEQNKEQELHLGCEHHGSFDSKVILY